MAWNNLFFLFFSFFLNYELIYWLIVNEIDKGTVKFPFYDNSAPFGNTLFVLYSKRIILTFTVFIHEDFWWKWMSAQIIGLDD